MLLLIRLEIFLCYCKIFYVRY